ncbi:MAG: UbiA family prenyltransferase, partial [Anaerolineales bacterium]|nr:UbiA family prenyltransferase [Anaerolineales bacterium]MDW8447777.1 UbiA family prenyltransferase [Anaerolineales bacterium]
MRFSYVKYLFLSMRPRQWIKNGVLFAAIVFDRQFNLAHIPEIVRTALGFLVFCLISGLVYLINDLIDIEADRKHPQKRNRPIASGKLPPSIALAAAILLPFLIFPFSYW